MEMFVCTASAVHRLLLFLRGNSGRTQLIMTTTKYCQATTTLHTPSRQPGSHLRVEIKLWNASCVKTAELQSVILQIIPSIFWIIWLRPSLALAPLLSIKRQFFSWQSTIRCYQVGNERWRKSPYCTSSISWWDGPLNQTTPTRNIFSFLLVLLFSLLFWYEWH